MQRRTVTETGLFLYIEKLSNKCKKKFLKSIHQLNYEFKYCSIAFTDHLKPYYCAKYHSKIVV